MNRVQEFEMRVEYLASEFNDLTYGELESVFARLAEKNAELKKLEE